MALPIFDVIYVAVLLCGARVLTVYMSCFSLKLEESQGSRCFGARLLDSGPGRKGLFWIIVSE